jgi:hypothetical protein
MFRICKCSKKQAEILYLFFSFKRQPKNLKTFYACTARTDSITKVLEKYSSHDPLPLSYPRTKVHHSILGLKSVEKIRLETSQSHFSSIFQGNCISKTLKICALSYHIWKICRMPPKLIQMAYSKENLKRYLLRIFFSHAFLEGCWLCRPTYCDKMYKIK